MTTRAYEEAVKFVDEQIKLIDISYRLDNAQVTDILVEERNGLRKTLREVRDELKSPFSADEGIGNVKQIQIIYGRVFSELADIKKHHANKTKNVEAKDAMTYSLEMIEAIVQRAAAKDGEVVKRTIEGPIPSKVHKDKRPCIEVCLIIEYPNGSSSKITCENPVDLDYSDKTDFSIEHLFV